MSSDAGPNMPQVAGPFKRKKVNPMIFQAVNVVVAALGLVGSLVLFALMWTAHRGVLAGMVLVLVLLWGGHLVKAVLGCGR